MSVRMPASRLLPSSVPRSLPEHSGLVGRGAGVEHHCPTLGLGFPICIVTEWDGQTDGLHALSQGCFLLFPPPCSRSPHLPLPVYTPCLSIRVIIILGVIIIANTEFLENYLFI